MRTSRMIVALLALPALVTSVGAAEQSYRIGGGDSLQITVWKNPELSQTVTVRPDGMITLPLVRDIAASGQTAMDLGKLIESKLSAFVNAPNVTVTVAAATNYRVYTYGALANGMFPLPAPMNVLQLLARAGGPSKDADLAAAFILRGGKRLPVDLEARPGGPGTENCCPGLEPEDVLVVPFRDATRGILVAGEVRTPTSLPFRQGMTVLDAFVAAGGGTEYADLGSVRVVRLAATTAEREIVVDLARMLKRGDLGKNATLLPGDIVVVPR